MRLEVPIFILIPMSFSFSMQNLINFEMEHQMGVYSATVYFPATRGRHLFDQQLTAPFDDDVLNTFVFVTDKVTNVGVHHPVHHHGPTEQLRNILARHGDCERLHL